MPIYNADFRFVVDFSACLGDLSLNHCCLLERINATKSSCVPKSIDKVISSVNEQRSWMIQASFLGRILDGLSFNARVNLKWLALMHMFEVSTNRTSSFDEKLTENFWQPEMQNQFSLS